MRWGPHWERLEGTKLVNNTLAVLRGTAPESDRIELFWGGRITIEPAAIFAPETPDARDGEWYWLGDGIGIGDKVHILAIRMRKIEAAVFGVATSGVNLLSLDLALAHPFGNQQQRDTPFFREPEGEHGDMTFGSGILVNTEAAGAPNPDGFIYVYGVGNDPSKTLMAARVRPEAFTPSASHAPGQKDILSSSQVKYSQKVQPKRPFGESKSLVSTSAYRPLMRVLCDDWLTG